MKFLSTQPISSFFLSAALSLPLVFSGLGCADIGAEDSQATGLGQGAELSLEWLIISGDTLVSCVDAGASDIEIAILGTSEIRKTVSCFGGFAIVDVPNTETAIVEVSLLKPDGTRLVTSELGEVSLQAGQTTPLGAVELSL